MRRQLVGRNALLAAGRRHLGWKLGFGSPAAMQRLGLKFPLVGFLTDRSLLESGATISIMGAGDQNRWTRAMLEPEIAVHAGADIRPSAGEDDVRRSIAALGAAIEIADVDPAVQDVESILAGDIFHRYVLLGPPDATRAGGDLAGINARVLRDGEEIAATSDPEALTGRLVEILRSAAATLESQGLALRAGDVVIAGSVVPPIAVDAGQVVRVEMSPLGVLEVRFA